MSKESEYIGELEDLLQSADNSIVAVQAELTRTKRALELAKQRFEQLKGVMACEGRPDGDTLLNGLQLASGMAACANPKYEMFEAYEAVEKWLKSYSIDTLARIQKELSQ